MTSLFPFGVLSLLVHLLILFVLFEVSFEKNNTSKVKYGYVEVLESAPARSVSKGERTISDLNRNRPQTNTKEVASRTESSKLRSDVITPKVIGPEIKPIDKIIDTPISPIAPIASIESSEELMDESLNDRNELTDAHDSPVSSERSAFVGQTDPVAIGSENEPPEYPLIAVKRGWEGDVLLNILVLADGTVSRTSVVESSGFKVLDDSAKRAVKNWRFTPATRGEENIEGELLMPIQFELR